MDRKEWRNIETNGRLILTANDKNFRRDFDTKDALLTILWNKETTQTGTIDGKAYQLPHNSLIALVANQTFHLEKPEAVVAWQFNRPFYCIVDHDQEVSCAGLLFYGAKALPMVMFNEKEACKIDLLYQVFLDEFDELDNLQEDMLRMLLKRLIIKTTRLYKEQTELNRVAIADLDITRQYNLLVEQHFKEWHQVQDYANALNKSPKTLSNLFVDQQQSPLRILHQRIILEAQRMLLYTDFSIKEIAFDLGFEEVPPFNRMFKRIAQQTPSQFRKTA